MDISNSNFDLDSSLLLNQGLEGNSSDPNKRRSSSRSIKRRKFDDELVEYSVSSKESTDPVAKKPPRMRTPSSSMPSTSMIYEGSAASPGGSERGRGRLTLRPSAKKSKKSRPPPHTATKDLGRWKPTDDLALITAVLQCNDLMMVQRGVKFSCRFTLREVQQRWYSLLYEPTVSKLAVNAMKALHPDIIASVESKTLYSKEEQAILAAIKSNTTVSLDTFEELLAKHSGTFHRARTAKALMSQWHLMKQYHLLDDQPSVSEMRIKNSFMAFSELEENVIDSEIGPPRDEAVWEQIALNDRREMKEMRGLEEEVTRWQVLVEKVAGVTPQEFDNHTLAVLKGRLVRYLMRSRQITLGRGTKDYSVDVDLTLEGPAWKVSRQQGTIRLRNNGDFFLMSEGKRPIYVDGRPILRGNKCRLNDSSLIEIAGLRFLFQINMDLISVIRQEAAKMNLHV